MFGPEQDDRERRRPFSTRFVRDEDGSLIIFGLFMFVAMLMIGGVAFDLMRHENVRTKLQNTSDAATLASANMNRADVVTIEDAKNVVRDYFAKAEMSPFLSDIKVTQNITTRKVSAKAQATIRTTFMRYSGVPELSVTTLGTAQQDAGDIEIALVLDISGSMLEGSKQANMKAAAKQFVNTVLPDSSIPEVDRPTISLVPYNDMVDIGPVYGPYWNIDNSHGYSWCTRLPSTVYVTSVWDTATTIERIAHFDRATMSTSTPISSPQCRTDGKNRVLMHQTDPVALGTYIDNNLAADTMGWTAISLGIKWGTAMLDPSTRTITNTMVTNGVLTSRAKDLPKNYVAPSGTPNNKVLVVMTDGANTLQKDLKPQFKSGLSNVYFAALYESYINNGVSAAYIVFSPQRQAEGKNPWYWPYAGSFYATNPLTTWGIPNVRLSNVELFNKQSVAQIGHRIYTSAVPEHLDYIYYEDGFIYSNAHEDYVNNVTLDAQTTSICAAAKAKGMIIYTVAFEAPVEGKTIMANCATSPAYYYEVSGTDIVLAFQSIGRNINQLRLTQ